MYRNCRHVQPSGLRCKSPSMRGSMFCYFHARLHGPAVELPPLETPEDLRESVAMVMRVLASSRIDEGRAKALLYGLQVAAQVLNSGKRSPTEKVRATPPRQSPDGPPRQKSAPPTAPSGHGCGDGARQVLKRPSQSTAPTPSRSSATAQGTPGQCQAGTPTRQSWARRPLQRPG